MGGDDCKQQLFSKFQSNYGGSFYILLEWGVQHRASAPHPSLHQTHPEVRTKEREYWRTVCSAGPQLHLKKRRGKGWEKETIMEKKERPMQPLFRNRCSPHRCGAIANNICHGILTTHVAYSRVYVQLKCTLQITLLSLRRNKKKIVLCCVIKKNFVKVYNANLL